MKKQSGGVVVKKNTEVYGKNGLAIDELAKKYSPNESDDSRFQEINKSFSNLNIIKIEIDDMSGKQSIELVNK